MRCSPSRDKRNLETAVTHMLKHDGMAQIKNSLCRLRPAKHKKGSNSRNCISVIRANGYSFELNNSNPTLRQDIWYTTKDVSYL